MKGDGNLKFTFTENTLMIIPLVYKEHRLDDDERLRFACLFKTPDGNLPYVHDIEEDNKGENGPDGEFTFTLDMSKYKILPGRYNFEIQQILASGSLITLCVKSDCVIDIIPSVIGEVVNK